MRIANIICARVCVCDVNVLCVLFVCISMRVYLSTFVILRVGHCCFKFLLFFVLCVCIDVFSVCVTLMINNQNQFTATPFQFVHVADTCHFRPEQIA